MKSPNVESSLENDNFFDLLNINSVEKEISRIKNSENITINQLKSMFNTGVELYNKFQFKEAELIFSSYSVLNPYDHRGPGCLAAIFLEQGKFSRALEYLNIVKTYPSNDFDETAVNISLCHYKLKEYIQASAILLVVKKDVLNEFYKNRYEYLQQQLKPYLS
ncbi:tetratricopeptide repeat protein [Vibrio aestuarianus]|uniref:Regulator n=1 Tax=Vibrio aestuarianus TaxID=28171 RepID=A0A9X4IZU8_9VIBR|nr:regulator [Vibrio aestuarianus]MDE1346291.1 regulator [Vibrio aestuarianus]